LNIKLNGLVEFVVTVLVGVFIFVIATFLARLLNLSFFVAALALLIIDLFYFRKAPALKIKTKFKNAIRLLKANLLLLIIISVAVFAQGWIHFTSGTTHTDSLSFKSEPFHDAAFHLALIGELKNNFPPENPIYAGEPFKNYHYLTDFLVAGINSLVPFPLLDLYFKILPVAVSVYYGLAIYALSSKFTKEKQTKNLAVFLAYFSGSLAYVIPLIRHGSWSANSFMFNQPFDYAFNTQSMFSLIILVVGCLILCEYQKQKKNLILYLSAIIFSLSFGFKSYVAVLGFIAFLVTAIYALLRFGNYTILVATLFAAIVFAILVLYFTDNSRNGISFSPGWTLNRMIEDPDRLYLPQMTLRQQHYYEKENLARVIQIESEKIGMYFIGNLGIRAIGLFYLLLIIYKKSLTSPAVIFLTTIALSGLLIPIIFNQQGSPYNIIQFGVYSLVILSVFSAIAIEKVRHNVSFLYNKAILLTALLILSIVSVPANIKTVLDQLDYGQFVISKTELEALNYLKNNTMISSTVLLYPSFENNRYAYVSALSSRRVFLSDRQMVDIAGLPYSQRESEVNKFFQEMSPSEQTTYLTDNRISYIYLTKDNLTELTARNKTLPFTAVFKSDAATIFKNQDISNSQI